VGVIVSSRDDERSTRLRGSGGRDEPFVSLKGVVSTIDANAAGIRTEERREPAQLRAGPAV
jgi:hypothetical protein